MSLSRISVTLSSAAPLASPELEPVLLRIRTMLPADAGGSSRVTAVSDVDGVTTVRLAGVASSFASRRGASCARIQEERESAKSAPVQWTHM